MTNLNAELAAQLEAERLRPSPRPVSREQVWAWYLERVCLLLNDVLTGRAPADPQGAQECEHSELWGLCRRPGCNSHVYDTETGQFLGYAKIGAGGSNGSGL